LKDTNQLVENERHLLYQLLCHLWEISRRKLYVEKKCGSLFEYCVKILKYSEGEASRRVRACRLLGDMPELSEAITNGNLNLTKLNMAKSFFDDQGIQNKKLKKEILEKLSGKTTRESENILWELKNQDAPRKVEVTILEETLHQLNKLKALKAHSCPDLDSLLQKMTKEVTRIWDPTLVQRKRELNGKSTRYIPVQIKAEVWKKHQGKCALCESTFALEIDHIKPFSVGGKTSPENLRLLCRNCNQRQGLSFFNKPSSSFFSST